MSIKAPKEESKKHEVGCSALNVRCSTLKGRELTLKAAAHKKPAAAPAHVDD
ncbi:hypothetical protein TIFTF001_020898 [Ficus carica]|uniref:Uncharacterized protein n=1 Tax=Ficus carica TaxID=3494 RepID=A0AA88DBD5_FICCA|nr:hypothetical protein TIFTF001_020898 [Ficus carica]